ncbi:hypothetical protein G6O69_14495 [Pseudenhygromyxa sp. WMMC2535]|uniref:hypothetical protein n=1 Tax=Pseudenhygromyxa sp. WMMC2535 TaxID=2712867 RepID=UPI0015960EEB|nr:hypothetical protein [Pseudenhygromyxa sp. WMMC2535]NVB39049.1 hypothetical protein [Pseudenhygromyxa sp. WMMC2535]
MSIAFGSSSETFVVEVKRRGPYRGELDRLLAKTDALRVRGTPLLLVPELGARLQKELVERGWSWADEQGNYDLRAPGFWLRQVGKVAEVKSPRLPGGLAGKRLVRWLIAGVGETSSETLKLKDLAQRLEVSAPAVSQIVRQLRQLGFVGGSRGISEVDRERLLHAFMREYPGAGGRTEYAYSLDAPGELAARMEEAMGPMVGLSADVGPDRIIPWRAPTTLVVYMKSPQLLSNLGLVPAEARADANVLIQYPEDMSVFSLPGSPKGGVSTLADPTQMLIDLHRLGGSDRLEAAEELERWLLK